MADIAIFAGYNMVGRRVGARGNGTVMTGITALAHHIRTTMINIGWRESGIGYVVANRAVLCGRDVTGRHANCT